MSRSQKSSSSRRKKKPFKTKSKPISPPPKIGSQEFNQLQSKWYQKLERSGFSDIEINGDLLHIYEGSYFGTNYTPKSFEEKKRYFERATELESAGIFLDQTERLVWSLHASGVPIRKIVEVLESRGIKKHKDHVNQIINDLQDMMERI